MARRLLRGADSHLGALSLDDAEVAQSTDGSEVPYPSTKMMLSVGSASISEFDAVGVFWKQIIFARPVSELRVLDIGCGCGRITRHLLHCDRVRDYIGFDIIMPSIAWCKKHLGPIGGEKFEFQHPNVYSEAYNPTGQLRADDICFTAADASRNLIVAASLFTHLLDRRCEKVSARDSALLGE